MVKLKMAEEFVDHAVPDGAESIGDDWFESDGTSQKRLGGGGGAGASKKHIYFGSCPDDNGPAGWTGPDRETRTAASADVAEHRRTHPDHHPSVQQRPGTLT